MLVSLISDKLFILCSFWLSNHSRIACARWFDHLMSHSEAWKLIAFDWLMTNMWFAHRNFAGFELSISRTSVEAEEIWRANEWLHHSILYEFHFIYWLLSTFHEDWQSFYGNAVARRKDSVSYESGISRPLIQGHRNDVNKMFILPK